MSTAQCITGNSSPTISRSSITKCTFTNLTRGDTISRSTLENVIFARDPPAPATAPSSNSSSSSEMSIKRSTLKTSTLTNSSIRHCTLTNSTLTNAPASSVRATDATLTNTQRIWRSELSDSTVEGSLLRRTSVVRCRIEDSSVRRSKLEDVRVAKSRLKKVVLRDCEVSECVIVGTEFTGMRLRFGVWRNGKLVGRIGEGEVVRESLKDEKKEVKAEVEVQDEKKLATLDYKILQEESEQEEESSETEDEKDVPPAYAN